MAGIRCEVEAGVTSIVLCAAGTGNALTRGLLEDLHHALEQAAADDGCRAIVLAAEGADFSSGMDLDAVIGDDLRPDLRACDLLAECLLMICRAPQPVVACVAGNVRGGGVGLAAACDLVVAGRDVTFMLPEVVVGLVPALIAPVLLRRLSAAQVRYLALSSRAIPALEARGLGLVDEVTDDSAAAAVDRQLHRLRRSSPRALAESKRLLERLRPTDLQRDMATARAQLAAWLEQPGVLADVKEFAQGFAPPWFAPCACDGGRTNVSVHPLSPGTPGERGRGEGD